MTNVIPLRPRDCSKDVVHPTGAARAFRLLDNISMTAEILEAMSAEVLELQLPRHCKEQVLNGLLEAAAQLEIASDALVDEAGGATS